MKNKLLVLRPIKDKNKPTKTLDKDLNKVADFTAGFKFNFKTFHYTDFHKVMKEVFSYEDIFVVLGGLTEFGQDLEDNGKAGQRLKRGLEPTIEDKLGTEIVLDLDDHIIPGFDPLNPEKAIKVWLTKRKIMCDVTVQITSSQKLNTEEARIRLYFTCSEPLPLLTRKAWSQSPQIGADGCVYTCNQAIYTAAPIIKDAKDPIKKRTFFIKRKTRTIELPKLAKSEIEEYISAREISDYDFSEGDLPDEVKEGKVYRRYFMPMAFSLINKGLGREQVFGIIKHKSSEVVSREFIADNVYQYIDTALEQYADEDHTKPVVPKSNAEKQPIPEFPLGLMESWPEPWPMIWSNIKKIPRVLEEPLLVPTILSLMGHTLHSNYITGYKRRPNLFYLNLAPSTGNKDVNSTNVIRSLDDIFKERGKKVSMFSGIMTNAANITADTSFIESFDEREEFFWINTEATRIFQMLKQSGSGNSNVAAISDKLIEVVDGHEIKGKAKAGKSVKSIVDPKCQVVFYAQPETIEKYIDEQMVDSGLFGRACITILPDLKFKVKEYDMFMETKPDQFQVTDDFYEFFTSEAFAVLRMNTGKTMLKPNEENRLKLTNWGREVCGPHMVDSDTYQKVLSRLGNTGEAIYTIMMGICKTYDIMKHKTNKDYVIRNYVDVECMIPLLTYYCETKVYSIENYINSSLDPLADEIEDVITEILNGKPRMTSLKNRKLVSEEKVVPIAQIRQILKNRKKLIDKLSDTRDIKDATLRTERIIDSLVRSGILVKKKFGATECVGFTKDQLEQ